MKTAQIRETLQGWADTVSQKEGVVTIRREFFYTHGISAEKIAAGIKRLIPGVEIIETGEIWKPFNGSGSTRANSHFLVRFRINENKAAMDNVAELHAAF